MTLSRTLRVWCAAVVAVAVIAVVTHDPHASSTRTDTQARATTTTSTVVTTTSTTATPTTSTPSTTAAPASTTTPAATPARPRATTTTVPPTTTTTHPHPARVITTENFIPYATVGPIVLHLPSDHVEAIGYHQSALDGAQAQTPVAGAPRSFIMTSRDRDTVATGAADIVVEPNRVVRVPVTGTVIRAGTYTLYCDYTDQYVVIEPDSHPGWEVKILHIQGLYVKKGQRVEAGVTWMAEHAHVLPFPSQVEEDTGLPAWPHVHVEVDDPKVPDRPTEPPCN